jgi:hypothetical protein
MRHPGDNSAKEFDDLGLAFLLKPTRRMHGNILIAGKVQSADGVNQRWQLLLSEGRQLDRGGML